jgi:hypothetical protein
MHPWCFQIQRWQNPHLYPPPNPDLITSETDIVASFSELNFSEGFNFTVSSPAVNISNSTLVIDVGANSNVTIELGYQTTPVQMQVETKAIDLASLIPPEALNVEVYQEISNDDSPLNPNPGFQITQEPAVINEPVGWTLSANGTFVKYTTPAPYLIENGINEGTKRVTVESTASVHYYNVTAFTDVTEVQQEQIRLFWFDNGTRIDVTHDPLYNLTFTDTDADGLIDNISWTVPRLSEQIFEVETNITIINVQSYPTLWGNWTARFNTTGTANLTITPVNGTSYGEDLEFLEMWCGSERVDAAYDASVFYPNWNCSTEGKIINRVLTTGKHTLEFRFGSSVKYAYNNINSNLNLTSDNITFVYDSGEIADVAETGDAKEGINLTVNAAIYNQGTSDSGTFYVLFYDGNSEFYNASMDSIGAGASANATGYWTTLPGTHNITIKVDPNNNTQDSDLSNNNASKLIDVSAWGKYYGNVSGNTVLADSAANPMLNWAWSNETNSGYVYVVNKSVSINWSALHPLGYDKNNNINASGQDFLDADTNLGMTAGTNNATGFTGNNMTELFTNTSGSNYGNISINKTPSIVHGRLISNVPIVNSTDMTDHTLVESASFITGILWDDTKDTNGYFDTADKEDLVFIANIRPAVTGLNGAVHNYEIAIPCALNPITAGDVDFYLELK